MDKAKGYTDYGVNDFFDSVRERLRKGKSSYKDESFGKLPSELVGEIIEELEDVCGWAFVLWRRLKRMEELFIRLEAGVTRGTA